MQTFSLKIEGLNDLIASAGKAGSEMTNLLQRTMIKATTWVQEEAKRTGPDRFKNQTGNLRRSIFRRVESAARGVIGVSEKYGEYVEFGTRAHVILPRKRKMLAFKVNGKLVFAKKVNHPGSRPYPYMQPALRNNVDRIMSEYANVALAVVRILAGK